MEKLLKKAMQASMSEVLGTMFYMPLEFETQESLEHSGLLKTPGMQMASLGFKGALSGTLVFLVPRDLLQAMTADFMGERVVSAEQMAGTLKEIANMVAGNTFSTYDSAKEFCLGIPELITPSRMASLRSGGKEIFLLVESVEGSMGVWMGLDS